MTPREKAEKYAYEYLCEYSETLSKATQSEGLQSAYLEGYHQVIQDKEAKLSIAIEALKNECACNPDGFSICDAHEALKKVGASEPVPPEDNVKP